MHRLMHKDVHKGQDKGEASGSCCVSNKTQGMFTLKQLCDSAGTDISDICQKCYVPQELSLVCDDVALAGHKHGNGSSCCIHNCR